MTSPPGTPLEAGRECDALVAEKVMGLNVVGRTWDHYGNIETQSGEGERDHPVYVERCNCDLGPRLYTVEELVSNGVTVAEAAQVNRERQAAWDADVARYGHSDMCLAFVPDYSTDIASAWLVVEKMMSMGWAFEYQNIHKHDATFSRRAGKRERVHADDCETAPLAICLCALEAMASLSPSRDSTPLPTSGDPR